jgi:pimeloyl-ACP methyl ester carboxylesterase
VSRVPELAGRVATVAVKGGVLTYEVRLGNSEPILVIHGVSSQRRLWDWLHAEAPELTLIAPDLRGRADSVEVAGPFSIDAHVADMTHRPRRLDDIWFARGRGRIRRSVRSSGPAIGRGLREFAVSRHVFRREPFVS